ncbi:GTP pyrophosphokinase YwaC [Clostridium liquoris]|jgi:ppGpp synthetase/RelA/SpoT-type nucleotidyltranferase|uniref:GTP pyrophosphokinase YwaC n=1 Tax=Clostridium liquoris TaxID=1289519 RepID=A0A2T0B3Z4_9CLOT|nr:hypothetical protein [Clostridium liquoris]PRR78543.1 GTP pyrophosphokinase YwaC [Clostridium liquoris]
MELKMFNFIEKSGEYLENSKERLEAACKDIELYFQEILLLNNDGYLSVNSRIKSASSLKEKILRNNYYKRYKSLEELFSNLSDLIGIRIECRFVEDENKIYKMLKKHFNKKDSNGYYYNQEKENIKLKLSGKQPQEQKNGFEIYRIDGTYQYNDEVFNFELQIKSLVNVFWGEIEHKIIYKNNNYIIADEFLKDIMGSVKKNLSMIDNQLLIIYNQFNKQNTIDPSVRKNQLEVLVAKIVYDIFSVKMKKSIGFIIDFKESCNEIVKYIFRENNTENSQDYNKALIKILSRLNDIAKNKVDFNCEIKFEREIHFQDEFSNIIGNSILKSINKDFQWNIFFRILFEIELGNNAEDFETYLSFLRNRLYYNDCFLQLYKLFKSDEAEIIISSLMKEIAYSFKDIDSIDFIYDCNIKKIKDAIEDVVKSICTNINSFDEWEEFKDIYLELLKLKVLAVFHCKVKVNKVKGYIKDIKKYPNTKIEVKTSILELLDKLETSKEIEAKEVVKIFKI